MERKKKGGSKMEGRRGEERKEGKGGEGEERENESTTYVLNIGERK